MKWLASAWLAIWPVSIPFALTDGPGRAVVPVSKLPPVFFCGESVPMHEEAVARQLLKSLAQNASYTRALYRIRLRAADFFPAIEPVLARYQIPPDFKYLPLVESALLGRAVSSAGAVGYWQLMPATARELGLIVRPGYDERRNLMKSTDAACRYLRYLYNQFGSWTLAAAAYNNGMGNLLGSIRRQQQRDYYYLRLNAETGKYLYRILAFKELFSNYRAYSSMLSSEVLTCLSQPLGNEALTDLTDEPEVLLPEAAVETMTKAAVQTSVVVETANRPADIPLPNAADVFRGGIKAKLVEAGELQRGQIWLFDLTRTTVTGGQSVSVGDRLYAVVEDIDQKTGKLYLRATKLYAINNQTTYTLALTAIDASTGRVGIDIPAVGQMKAGWILTWKVL